MSKEFPQNLSDAVGHWLSFQVVCGRAMIFSESNLCQPIAEFLLNKKSSESIVPEYNHTQHEAGKKGRPLQIDFAITARKGNKSSPTVQTIIESKWISGQLNKEAILDDIIRLESFDTGTQIKRYFLIAGTAGDIQSKFFDAEINHKRNRLRFARQVFTLDSASGEPRKIVECQSGPISTFFKDKSKLPKSITTILAGEFKNELIKVYVWEIQRTKGRKSKMPA